MAMVTTTSTALTEAAVIGSVGQPAPAPPTAYELALVQGDLGKLSAEERLSYYQATCRSLGLNPLTRPFDYITLNGKLTLYAKRDAADQLRRINRVSVSVTSRETIGDIYVVTARATLPDGRADEEIGAVNIAGLRGEALANALMKASTKAKRRVTLSICGLGWLDETEVETIPDARPAAASGTEQRYLGTTEAAIQPAPVVPPHPAAKLADDTSDGAPLWWVGNVLCEAIQVPGGKRALRSTEPCPVHGMPFYLSPTGDPESWAHKWDNGQMCSRTDVLTDPAQ